MGGYYGHPFLYKRGVTMTFRIDGISVSFPSEISITYSDLDGESYRNAKGELIRDRIATKTKIEAKWNFLRNTEIATLLQSVKNEFFSVQYFDPYEGKVVTKTMYVGDRTAPCYTQVNGKYGWKNVSFNLIQK